MQSDSLTEFLTQSGILNLLIAVIGLGILWVVLVIWALRRDNERRRRRKAGEPPLPNFLVQLMNWAQGQNQPSVPTAAIHQDTGMPMPSLDDLTTDLPEPDFDDLPLLEDISEPPSKTDSIPEAISPAASVQTPRRFADVPEPETTDEVGSPIMEMQFLANSGQDPTRSAELSYTPGSNALPADAVEVIRVWRDVSDGALIFQMGDRIFQTLPEMYDNGFSKRFIRIVEDMARVAHAGAVAAGINPPDFQRSSAIISQQGDWARKQQPTIPPASPIENLPSATPTPTQFSAGDSIADQIEELLQMRLSQVPAYQKRSIHVRANIDGTLRIEVDGRNYPHLDEVVDVNVRDFIQNVIREWEARQ